MLAPFMVVALAALPANLGYSGTSPKTVEQVFELFHKFLDRPGSLSVDVKVHVGPSSNFPDGTETIVVIPRHAVPAPQIWDIQRGNLDLHFVCNGKNSLEWSNSEKRYDLHLARSGMPYGRIYNGDITGYPMAIAFHDLRAAFGPSVKLKDVTAKYILLSEDDKGMGGEKHLLAKVASDGRLISMSSDERGPTGRLTVDLTFSNYRSSPSIPAFNIKPKVGLTALRFPEDVDVLKTGDSMPNVRVTGPSSKATLSKLAASGFKLVVFTEEALPATLEQALANLSSVSKPVLVSSTKISSHFPVYLCTQAGLDQAGVASTPQFYLTHNGKLVQAWQGWDATKSDQFTSQIKAAVKAAS